MRLLTTLRHRSNIYSLVPANTIGFSHSILVLKSQSASDLQAIDFARLAAMCRITGIKCLMAEHIEAFILANPAPYHSTSRRQ